MEEHEAPRRHKVGIDCISLDEGDALVDSAEEEGINHLSYLEILRDLPTDREKFIALALDFGIQADDIAFILRLHPSRVTRWKYKIRIRIKNRR